MKLFMVTKKFKVNKKTEGSRVVGFITTFGWEKPQEKAAKKYPELGAVEVHENWTKR